MESSVFTNRLENARLFLTAAILCTIAVIVTLLIYTPMHQTAVVVEGSLSLFYWTLSVYWYVQLWQWVRFRRRHPALDNKELDDLLYQAMRRPQAKDTSTLSDAFSEPPATN